MKSFSFGKRLGVAIIFLLIAMPVFAESAPVYDADTPDQQFEHYDQSSDYPPPPEPEQENSFESSTQSSPSTLSPSNPSSSSLPVEERVRRVEQQINNMQSNDLSERLNTLQGEVQSLRGQMEQLMHEMEQVQNQQKSMYTDLDKRISKREGSTLESATKAAPDNTNGTDTHPNTVGTPNDAMAVEDTSAAADSVKATRKSGKGKVKEGEISASSSADPNQPNVAEEQQIYQTAYNLIKAKKYNEAITILQNMLKKYPSGQFAANAHYWLGELYGLMGKNDKALAEFNTVIKTYPRSPRISDAELKVGLIYAAEFNWANAKAAFKKVVNRYPGTASARLASDQLKQIRQAGH